jgi:hypothetical protein
MVSDSEIVFLNQHDPPAGADSHPAGGRDRLIVMPEREHNLPTTSTG